MMNKKILLAIALVFVFALVAFSFEQFKPSVFTRRDKVSAPDFSLKDIHGKTFRLSAQRGNPVIMFFGTTWCPACREEMPLYRNLYNKYAGRGLKFLYIDINESAERVARFAGQNAFPYHVLVDGDGSVAGDYNIIGVPTLILLDREGNIVDVGHRISDLPVDRLFSVKK
ncbi:MAG TPA: TlpA disulfide reductase family protein [Smithella sp.]|jgi:peroxiredoxin|nr:TlpA disulfide reductase family protein [Smithella sp.]HOG10323.1 TlpA disulfide reductase family protein [Smithella sp.]HOS15359.1 TlpA disulfide reductase family protein [Smithella sp.]HPC08467.1 TlpA disulfide reductase family protein [Smithella sp.]HQI23292.1 TlpA disulfide reductase family protein [Smithella sp.]